MNVRGRRKKLGDYRSQSKSILTIDLFRFDSFLVCILEIRHHFLSGTLSEGTIEPFIAYRHILNHQLDSWVTLSATRIYVPYSK